MEGLDDRVLKAVDILDQVVVLRAGARDACGIRLLKRIIADQMRRNLPVRHTTGTGIHKRIGQSGHGICRARPGSDKDHAGLAGRSCISFGRMNGGLFMTDKNVPDLVVLEQGVVDWKDRAARIAEDDFNTFILKRLQQSSAPGIIAVAGFSSFLSPATGADFGMSRPLSN